MEIAELLRNRP